MLSYLLVLFGVFYSSKDVSGNGCDIVSRNQWNAKPTTWLERLNTPVKQVFIHHTAGRQCSDFDSCVKIVQGIQDFHMFERKWDDIGYNFLIGGDGRVYEGRGWASVGAHVYGFNSVSLGFSLMGNYVDCLPSQAMLNATKAIIECGKKLGYITQDAKLHGHRDAGCTECPGKTFYAEIQTWPNFEPGPLPGWKCWTPPKE